MANQVLVAKTTEIKVAFYADGVLTDPVTVEGFIYDEALNQIDTFSPTNPEVGVWKYDWTPLTVGSFYIEFKGTFADSSIDIARELFEVVASVDYTSFASTTLREDQFITFLTTLTPMYIDVQAILDVYPDLDPVVVAEYIYIASLEAKEMMGSEFKITETLLAYVYASALCSLSKIYAVGDYNAQSIQLGDLMIAYRTPGGGSINRGNAANWCELAFALAGELLSSATSPQYYLKASAWENPIPTRGLKSYD